jgi:hypothetical protein
MTKPLVLVYFTGVFKFGWRVTIANQHSSSRPWAQADPSIAHPGRRAVPGTEVVWLGEL